MLASEWTGPKAGSPDASVRGLAPEVLLWLWNRGGENVTTTIGDDDTIALLRTVVAAVLGNRSED